MPSIQIKTALAIYRVTNNAEYTSGNQGQLLRNCNENSTGAHTASGSVYSDLKVLWWQTLSNTLRGNKADFPSHLSLLTILQDTEEKPHRPEELVSTFIPSYTTALP